MQRRRRLIRSSKRSEDSTNGIENMFTEIIAEDFPKKGNHLYNLKISSTFKKPQKNQMKLIIIIPFISMYTNNISQLSLQLPGNIKTNKLF